ncbi:MAG: sulfatase [Planctomycetota bacterium]
MTTRPGLPPLLGALLAILAGCAMAARGDRRAPPPPNIVFVMVDDLGWMDLHVQGNSNFDTPNLDRLAAGGMRFTDAYAAAPVCSPTRAACVTGRSPARLAITNHIPDRWSFYDRPAEAGGAKSTPTGRTLGPAKSRNELPTDCRTIAHRLRESGYRTAFVGKWHLAGADWRTTDPKCFPESFGFDVNVAGNAMGGPGTFFGPIEMPNYRKGKRGDYLPDLLAQEAIDQLTAAKAAATPLFLCLWTYTVHYPIEAPAELYARHAGSVGDGEPDMPTRYRAMVEGMDRAVGRVLRALDELELASNTLVVFTSDNGQMPGASVADPLRGAKGHLHEGGIRVPLIVRWPGRVPAGVVEATPVVSMDFAPTFLSAAGVSSESGDFDGVDLSPILFCAAELERDALFWHFPHYAYHGRNHMGGAVRSGRWKYIHHYDDEHHELYDLHADIGESRNLHAIEPARAAVLRERLFGWLAETGAAMPRPYDEIPADELPGTKRTTR